MNFEKQKLFLNYLISSQDLFTKVNPILESKYFDSRLKNTVAFVKSYFEQYKGPPTPEQVKAETDLAVAKQELSKSEVTYAEQELERFCKEKAIEGAILASPELLEKQDYGKIEALIRSALTVSLQKNIGLDYFSDPEARLKSLAQSAGFKTGWYKLDEAIGGGLNRKEMIIFAAPSGVGKSISMSNLARNLVRLHHFHGVYYTLELSEPVVAKRFDSMFTGIPQHRVVGDMLKVATELKKIEAECGSLAIKRLPESTTTVHDLRAHLKEYEIVRGHAPDFLVVDYLDLMSPTQQVSVENQFVRDKYIAEELRALADEYNLIMVTASQLNRGAQHIEDIEQLNHSHIAGGISKINTSDNFVAIYQTPQMFARGEMTFKLLKTRGASGVNSHFIMKFDGVSLRMEVLGNSDEPSAALSKSISNYAKRGRLRSGDDEQGGEAGGSPPPSAPLKPKDGPNRLDPDNLPFQV